MSSKEQNQKPKAFVIMPFADEFTLVFEDLIKPALEESGYEVSRADSLLDQQNILRSIVKGITSAKLVVAELTGLNPNVFYELGLCHGLNIPTILIAQNIAEVPFDLRTYKIQPYSVRFNEVQKLKTKLKEIAEGHLRDEIIFGNPVTDFSSSEFRGNQEKEEGKEPFPPALGQKQKKDKGILEANIASRAFKDGALKIATEINNTVSAISPLLDRLDEVTKQDIPGSTEQAQAIAGQIASELDRSSDRIESYLPELSENIDTPLEVFISYITTINPDSDKSKEDLSQYRTTFGELAKAMPGVIKKIRSHHDSIAGVGLRSGIIAPASRRNSAAIGGLIVNMERLEAFCQRIVQICNEKLNDSNKD